MSCLVLEVCLISSFVHTGGARLSNFAASFHQRTFQGLDASGGTTQPSVMEQGRSGTAQGYNELNERDGG